MCDRNHAGLRHAAGPSCAFTHRGDHRADRGLQHSSPGRAPDALPRQHPPSVTTVRVSVPRDECAGSRARRGAPGPTPGGWVSSCYFLGKLCVHLCHTWASVPKAVCTPLGGCVHELGSQDAGEAAVPSRQSWPQGPAQPDPWRGRGCRPRRADWDPGLGRMWAGCGQVAAAGGLSVREFRKASTAAR